MIGTVTRESKDKTAVVEVQSFVIHTKYKKRMARSKKFLIHDEIGVNVGDTVRFEQMRPMSKLKRWKAVEVVK
jgi:small subunit ribosomal protein S17